MASVELFEAALRALQDNGQRLSSRGTAGLSDLDPNQARRLYTVMRGMSVEARCALLERLVEAADRRIELDFEAIARLALSDEDGSVRAQAIRGLWESKDWRLAEKFLGLVKSDPDGQVRLQAVIALGRFLLLSEYEEISAELGRRIGDCLLHLARSDQPMDIRRRAVESLGFSSREEVPEVLRTYYEDPDPLVRSSVLVAMGRTADWEAWQDCVIRELRSPNVMVRVEAAGAAGELELKKSIPDLIELLEDADSEVRKRAIWALGEVGGRRARQALDGYHERATEKEKALVQDALDNLEFESGLADFALLDFDPDKGRSN
ncbi:MAG: HEAT repeat domain-containing protein [Anaerolineales bacterium]|jgi:HEAT repeat protein